MERHNNFDALRLVAAASVVFSHSFLIAQGTQDHEWLILLTGNQSILGLAGVFVFFAISGFLVTQSFEQTSGASRFLAKRALRIFPGLFMATLVSGNLTNMSSAIRCSIRPCTSCQVYGSWTTGSGSRSTDRCGRCVPNS